MSDIEYAVLNEVVKSIGIESILTTIGLKYKKGSDKYWFSSPFREDKNPSMCLYTKNFYIIDFASDWKGSIFQLFREVTGKSLFSYFSVGQTYLMDKTFESALKVEKKRDSFENVKKVRIDMQRSNLVDIKDSEIARQYCERRGIDEDIIREFDVKYSVYSMINGTDFEQRICIPIYHEGKLISMEGRDVTGTATRKVMYPKQASVATLFNLNNLDRKKPLVVVEGIMDLIKVWKYLTKNVTTPFGVWLTDTQEILFEEFENIILFPDDDEGGTTLISKFDQFYSKEFDIMKVYGKDPGESSPQEILDAYAAKMKSVDYFIKESGLFEDEDSISNSEWGDLL